MTRSEGFIIRFATLADVEGITRIAILNCTNPWNRRQITEEIVAGHAVVFCALIACDVVGFVDMHVVEKDAHINEIAVGLASRRRGIGKALLERCIEAAKSKECDNVSLEVRRSAEAARDLYESIGFITVGVRKSFYREPDDDAIVMILELNREDGYDSSRY